MALKTAVTKTSAQFRRLTRSGFALIKVARRAGFTRIRSALTAAFVALVVAAAGGLHIRDGAQSYRAAYRDMVAREVESHGRAVEHHLQHAFSAVSLLGNMLQHQGEIRDFQRIAGALVRSYGLISTLQLAPKGVVSNIYPLQGEEKAIGHNLLADPARRDDAQAAIDSRRLMIAPPVTLIQGGQAIVGRLPVFLHRDGNEEFWGFVIALIRVSRLHAAAHLDELAQTGHDYVLSYQRRDGERKILAENTVVPLRDPIRSVVPLPSGDSLVLSAAPRDDWPASPLYRSQLATLAVVVLLIGAFVYMLLRRPEVLRHEVALRTRELSQTNARLAKEIAAHDRMEEALRRTHDFLDSVVENIPAMVFVKDARDLRFVRFNRSAEELLGYSREEMIGRNDYDFFPKNQADFFTAKDREVLTHGGLSDIQVEEIDTRGKGRRLLHTKKIPILDKHGAPQYLLGIAEDITDQRATETRLRQINKVYNVLSAASDAILRIHDRRALLHEICRILVGCGKFGMASVCFARPDHYEFDITAVAGDQTPFPLRLDRAVRDPARGQTGILKSITDGKPVICQECDAVENIWCRDTLSCGYSSCAAFPVRHRSQVTGALALFSKEPGHFGAEETHLLGRLAEKISFALDVISNAEQNMRAEKQLQLAARVFENSAEGIMITDAANRIVSVNKTFTTFTLYCPEEVMGKNPSFLASGKHDAAFYRDMWRSLNEAGRWQGEIENRRKSGEIYPEWLNVSVVRDEAGEVVNYIAIFTDLTMRKQIEERERLFAHYDALTSLPNRAFFEEQTRRALAAAHDAKHLAAVIFLDIDRFSIINETFGHRIGDDFLKEVARRLQESVLHPGCVARLGGDEFTVILPCIENPRDAGEAAQKILDKLGRPITVGGHETYSTASVGIAVFPNDGADADTLNRNADTAMHRAINEGGSCYRFYTRDMNAASRKRVTLESRLHQALDRSEFDLHYQPFFDAHSRLIVGAEALLRWNGSDHESTGPDTFVPVLEETGLILPVGHWVLRTACTHNRAWRNAGFPNLFVAVNFSARQFRDRAFFQSIDRTLREAGGNPKFLEIELTERILMHDAEETIRILKRLKSLGARVSVDDFGTGYSSLSYLQRFPIDVMKIDMSFVQEAPQKPKAAAIVKSIIAISQALGLKTIAEGVETTEQAQFVTRHGCDLLQGYLLSRPLSHDGFLRLLCLQKGFRQAAITNDVAARATAGRPDAPSSGVN